MQDIEFYKERKHFQDLEDHGELSLRDMQDQDILRYSAYLEEEKTRAETELKRELSQKNNDKHSIAALKRAIVRAENSQRALIYMVMPEKMKVPEEFARNASDAADRAVIDGVNDEETLEDKNEAAKAERNERAEMYARKYEPNRNNALMIRFAEMYGLGDHALDYDEKKGVFTDINAGNQVVAYVKADKKGDITEISADRARIADIIIQEKDAMESVKAKIGLDDDKLNVVYRKGHMFISDKNTGEQIAVKKFKKAKVKDLRRYDFEMDKDGMTVRAKYGLEKIAEALIDPLKELGKKAIDKTRAEDKEEDIQDTDTDRTDSIAAGHKERKAPRPEDHIYDVAGYRLDYKNMRNYVNLLLEPVMDDMDISRDSVQIHMNGDGSGLVTGEYQDNEVTLADINEDHEVSIYNRDQILKETAPGYEEARDPGSYEYNEPLFVPPEKTHAVTLLADPAGEHFVTVDYQETGEKAQEMGYDDKAKDEAYKKNLVDSINRFAKDAGIDPQDVLLADGCSYVVTTSGQQLGILNMDGTVLADQKAIEQNQAIADIAREAGTGLDRLTTDDAGNIMYKDNPETVIAVPGKDGSYVHTDYFEKGMAQEKVLDDMVDALKSHGIKADRDSYSFNENGDIISNDYPDDPIAVQLTDGRTPEEGTQVVHGGEGLRYAVNTDRFVEMTRLTKGEFSYEDRRPGDTGAYHEQDTEKTEMPASSGHEHFDPGVSDVPINVIDGPYYDDGEGGHFKDDGYYEGIQENLAEGSMTNEEMEQATGQDIDGDGMIAGDPGDDERYFDEEDLAL